MPDEIEISSELRKKFVDLVLLLDPDTVLTNDDDEAESLVHAHVRQMHGRWEALEREAGRRVNVEEVTQWILDEVAPDCPAPDRTCPGRLQPGPCRCALKRGDAPNKGEE